MDEIDSIGSSRIESGSGGDSEVQRTMLELLNQLDGFEATKNIKVSSRVPAGGGRIVSIVFESCQIC
jgi:ATP-dependent 26S proteasome regulatory subunit